MNDTSNPLDELLADAARLDAEAAEHLHTADTMLAGAGQHAESACRKRKAAAALRGEQSGPPAKVAAPAREPAPAAEALIPPAEPVPETAPATAAESPAQADPPAPSAAREISEFDVPDGARRPAAERRSSAYDKVPCDICGRLINRSAVSLHRGSRPCIARRNEQDAADANATSAPVAPAAKASPGKPYEPKRFKPLAKALLSRGLGRAALCEAAGIDREDFDAIMADERVASQDDVRRLLTAAASAAPSGRGSTLRAAVAAGGADA